MSFDRPMPRKRVGTCDVAMKYTAIICRSNRSGCKVVGEPVENPYQGTDACVSIL